MTRKNERWKITLCTDTGGTQEKVTQGVEVIGRSLHENKAV